jgi:hypothetical protein
MTAALEAPFPIPGRLAMTMAALGPIAIGGILATRAGALTPIVAAPAIVFGVVAATAPALYIATAAAGHAPRLSEAARAFGVALGAFGIALAGLILPAAFLSMSSASAATTIVATTGAIAAAGYLGLRRLARELHISATVLGVLVFVAWSAATAGIAGRLWWDLAAEVVS